MSFNEETNQSILPDILQTLGERVVTLLKERKLTLACAESCTGGLVSAAVVSVPCASKVFKEGIVTYSNEAKVIRLGVAEGTLAKYGAVSLQTAEEMAKGAVKALNADIGVSVTGIAGPGGGSVQKPIGLVYIGVYFDNKVNAYEYRFSGNRAQIRLQSAAAALERIGGLF